MKLWRLSCGFLLAIGAAGLLQAQPEPELRQAIDRLGKARNYSWDEKRLIDWSSGPRKRGVTPTSASGETEIEGFTTARLDRGRHEVVFWGDQTAFKLKSGWRHMRDLTDEEAREVGLPGASSDDAAAARRAQAGARNYKHVLPHEILRFVLPMITNVTGHANVWADLSGDDLRLTALELYISTGRLLPLPAPQPPVSLLGKVLKRPPPPHRIKAVMEVALTDGNIDMFAIKFTKIASISVGGDAPEQHETTTEFRYELRDIGATKVAVDPLARALFLKDSAIP